MKTADANRVGALCRARRDATGVQLVARLHVDLCRCMSAACHV
ncbi:MULTISPECIES: hypothetical protein [Streptomyces]|nr:hypothetical protein [Streptomyces thermoviolaceus]WTD46182.1 hypothetical protein OG899_00825 [Streptomyces thermoviolaceus]